MILPSFTTHLLNTGKGNCIIIEWRCDNEESIIGLVDCCDGGKLIDYLSSEKIEPTRVAFVAATHPHEDHIAGLASAIDFFRTMGAKVEEFWHCGLPFYTGTYENLIRFVKSNRIKMKKIKAKKARVKYNLNFVPLAPPSNLRHVINPRKFSRLRGVKPLSNTEINNASIVMNVFSGNARVLLGADAEFGCWAFIENQSFMYLKAKVFKVPHHGSRNGNPPQQLRRRIVPEHALISGRDSVWAPQEFPHPETLSFLRTVNGIKVYCTKDHGNIKIETGHTSVVSTELGAPPFP